MFDMSCYYGKKVSVRVAPSVELKHHVSHSYQDQPIIITTIGYRYLRPLQQFLSHIEKMVKNGSLVFMAAGNKSLTIPFELAREIEATWKPSNDPIYLASIMQVSIARMNVVHTGAAFLIGESFLVPNTKKTISVANSFMGHPAFITAPSANCFQERCNVSGTSFAAPMAAASIINLMIEFDLSNLEVKELVLNEIADHNQYQVSTYKRYTNLLKKGYQSRAHKEMIKDLLVLPSLYDSTGYVGSEFFSSQIKTLSGRIELHSELLLFLRSLLFSHDNPDEFSKICKMGITYLPSTPDLSDFLNMGQTIEEFASYS
jgi:hypothetical protein